MTCTASAGSETSCEMAPLSACAPCVDDQIVAASRLTSATAHDAPMEACIWNGHVYRACSFLLARAIDAGTSLASVTTRSVAGVLMSVSLS
jgi:hypothetical protein